MVLTPCYEKRTDRLNYHQDKFMGEPELVCSYYVGSNQTLYIKSFDKRYANALKCSQGMIRIFLPIMNILFFHGKYIDKIKKPHFCLTLRTSKKKNKSLMTTGYDFKT